MNFIYTNCISKPRIGPKWPFLHQIYVIKFIDTRFLLINYINSLWQYSGLQWFLSQNFVICHFTHFTLNHTMSKDKKVGSRLPYTASENSLEMYAAMQKYQRSNSCGDTCEEAIYSPSNTVAEISTGSVFSERFSPVSIP